MVFGLSIGIWSAKVYASTPELQLFDGSVFIKFLLLLQPKSALYWVLYNTLYLNPQLLYFNRMVDQI